MSPSSAARAHLVERAVEALGGPDGLGLRALPPAVDAAPPAAAREGPASAEAAPPVPRHAIGRDALARAGLATAPARSARSRASEEVTVIQQQLLRAVQTMPPEEGRCNRVVLVTSARPGEGKSFCALNIAASVAAGGASPVALVDADAKAGSLSDLLGCTDLPGLRHLAVEPERRPAPLLVPTELDLLSFLPFGAWSENGGPAPVGPMLAAALLRLGAALRTHILVVDAPPCLATSDASALAPVAGQVLMVVEAERTQRNEVEAALDLVESCPTLQLLLNRARVGDTHSFGAYGGYGAQRGGTKKS